MRLQDHITEYYNDSEYFEHLEDYYTKHPYQPNDWDKIPEPVVDEVETKNINQEEFDLPF